MSTISIQTIAPRKAPYGAELLGRAAAALWQWSAGRLAQHSQPHDPRQDLPQLWALADKYQSVDPSLAADLRGAALRWERETQQS
jgi:hypothetical protein